MPLVFNDEKAVWTDDSKINVYVPANFNAEDVLHCDERWGDSARWLVDRLFVYSHFGMREDRWGFTPLKVEYLRRVIPQTIERDLRERMQDAGVIECDGHYVKGKKSLGYRLTNKYRTRHRRVPIRHCQIQANIERVRKGDLEKLSPVHRHLFQQFRRMSIDLSSVEVDDPKRLEWKDFSVLAAEQIKNHEWTPVVCEYGRFHTPLTRMMREYRSGIKLDGQKVINLDIANSQPLMLGLLFNKVLSKDIKLSQEHEEDNELMETLIKLNLTEEEVGTKREDKGGGAGNTYTMVGVNKEIHEDVRQYVRLCEDGKLYESLNEGLEISRDELKVKLFKDVLYGQNYIVSQLSEKFDRLFPHVNGFIKRLKKGNYKRLAWIMQREESRLMVDTVCGRLMREHPEIPLLTIHDSIMTVPKYESVVRETIQQEFGRVGLSPTIRTEVYE